jgi:hypothetical protein
MQVLIKVLTDVDKSLVHECPYSNIVLMNQTVDLSSIPNILPRGDYRFVYNTTTKSNEVIGTMQALASVFSSETNTFG